MTSMFDRYGGFAKIDRIVIAFYGRVLVSDVVAAYFEQADMSELIDQQTKFIAQVMGGPASDCDEPHRKFQAAHYHDRMAFDEITGLLRKTFADFRIEPDDVNRIMKDFASYPAYRAVS